MNPYWKNNQVTLYHGDCREVLQRLPAQSLSAIITDPPYGKVVDEAWDNLKTGELYQLLSDVVQRGKELITRNGTVAMFCYPHFEHRLKALMESQGLTMVWDAVWRKGRPMQRSIGTHNKIERARLRRCTTESERIVMAAFPEIEAVEYHGACEQCRLTVMAPMIEFFRQAFLASGISVKALTEHMAARTGTRYTFARHSICYSQWEFPTAEQFIAAAEVIPGLMEPFNGARHEDARRQYEELRRQYEELRRQYEELRRPFFPSSRTYTDIWEFPPVMPGGRHRHPCAKPVELMCELIKTITRPGDTILDPFGGGGATAEAAMLTGRKCIICEREQKYADYIVERIATILPMS